MKDVFEKEPSPGDKLLYAAPTAGFSSDLEKAVFVGRYGSRFDIISLDRTWREPRLTSISVGDYSKRFYILPKEEQADDPDFIAMLNLFRRKYDKANKNKNSRERGEPDGDCDRRADSAEQDSADTTTQE